MGHRIVGRTKDLIGQRFGKLVVTERLGTQENNRVGWKCLCDCGNEKTIKATYYLTSGDTSSCGCLQVKSCREKLISFKLNNPPANTKDLKHKVFGRLLVIDLLSRGGAGKENLWLCLCTCGQYCLAKTRSLTTGNKRSCGCLRREITSEISKTHGLSGTRLHKVWKGMWSRCRNHPRYYERGITVWDTWKDYGEFKDWAYGLYPHLDELMDLGYSIDRIDNDKGYSPENCRWATSKEQTRNRSITLWVTLFGEPIVLAEAVEKYGVNVSLQCVYDRLHLLKWTIEEALGIPPLRKDTYLKLHGNQLTNS